jgi:hypothetical protein
METPHQNNRPKPDTERLSDIISRVGKYVEAEHTAPAQFIAICRSAKTCEIGENLLSVADPISRLQERLSHVGALIHPPTLQRRPVSGLHSYVAMERSATSVSPVPEPGRRSLGAVPLPPRLQTLLVSRLQAHL